MDFQALFPHQAFRERSRRSLLSTFVGFEMIVEVSHYGESVHVRVEPGALLTVMVVNEDL